MIATDGPSRITFYGNRFSVGVFPKTAYRGWYWDSYSDITLINLGRLLRIAWW